MEMLLEFGVSNAKYLAFGIWHLTHLMGMLYDTSFYEGLHALINKYANARDIRVVSLHLQGPKLTHDFLVNDRLVFCRASLNNFQNILYEYKNAYGQHR